MIQTQSFRWLLATAMVAGWLLSPAASRAADELNIGGITYGDISGIKVDSAQGLITFRWGGRGEQFKSLADYRWIQLDAYPSLAQANKAADDGKHDQAARAYASIRPDNNHKWLRGLVLVNQVQSADKAALFSLAAEGWVDYQKLGWVSPKLPAPTNLPDKDSPELRKGIRVLENAVGVTADPELKKAFQSLLLAAYQKQGSSKAAELAREMAGGDGGDDTGETPDGSATDDGPVAGSASDQAALARVQEQLNARKWDQAIAKARESIPTLSRASVPAACMLVGEAFAGKGDSRRAALAYMRVVFHFADSAQAPEAMLRVGALHEKLGRKDVARRVYNDLKQRYRGSSQAAKADAALEALGN